MPDDELVNRRMAALTQQRGSLEHSLTAAQPCPDGLITCALCEGAYTSRSSGMPIWCLMPCLCHCRSLRILLASCDELNSAEQQPEAAWNQVQTLYQM